MAFIMVFLLPSSAHSATPAVIPELEPSGGCSVSIKDFVLQIKVREGALLQK